VLLRLAYLAVTNVFALLRLLSVSDRDKDAEILALRHQLTVLERQLGKARPRFSPVDRAFLATLLHRLPRDMLGRFRLLVRPETVLRWHWDLLVLRLARENPSWDYRRIHGEVLVLGIIKVAASTVWEILHQAGIDLAPERTSSTWASFLRSQAGALLACDFFETVTLGGARLYVLAVIEHASRRIRMLGATPHPAASWVEPAAPALRPARVRAVLQCSSAARGNSQRPATERVARPIPELAAATHLHVRRCDRLGGILHEYRHAA
jgi:putative transposase